MTDAPPIITSAEVATLLGIAKSTLQDGIAQLRRAHHFPAAIPGSGGRRYSRAAILAWINGARPTTPPPTAATDQDVATAEAVLLHRARTMLAAE